MSIEAREAVWKHSTFSGTKLVLMLAIADHVNENKGNVAWPGVPTLARLARMSERHVQRALRALKRSGELQIIPNQGPKGTNHYKVCLPLPVIGDIPGAADDSAAQPTVTF